MTEKKENIIVKYDLIQWILKNLIWNYWIVIKETNDNKLILENYCDWEKEWILIYNKYDLNDLTSLINEITNNTYEKWWCENLYVIKGVWHKLECKNSQLETVWRLLFEIQSWYTENKKEELNNVEIMIQKLEKYKNQLEEEIKKEK